MFFFFLFRFSQPTTEEQLNSESVDDKPTTTTKANKKRKNKNLSDNQRLLTDMSDERLQVYGLNPKRFRNFVRFNKDK